MSATFTWLHLSDLHAGMTDQRWLWPTLKHVLHNDLRVLHDQIGSWDAVVFSGDLTQQGSVEQFDLLNRILEDLWALFASLSFCPTLVCVPGNHDLVRPPLLDPGAILLKLWWEQSQIHEETWTNANSLYRKTISDAFENYSCWTEKLSGTVRMPSSLQKGLLPGDFSATINTQAGDIGLVGLNSAWLQLDEKPYEKKLLVHPRQLHSVTADDPVAWCARHSANILISHHPINWFHPSALESWQSEINPAGRFDLHLFGHMHIHDAITHAHGGGEFQKSIQAASIFGLEKLGNSVERMHGYSIGKFTSDRAEFRIWPRRLEKMKSLAWKLVADTSLDLDASNSFVMGGADAARTAGATASVRDSPPSSLAQGLLGDSQTADALLEKVRYFIAPSPASENVRRLEQNLCKAALVDMRACWIVAEWGAGADGFISALGSSPDSRQPKIYLIDLEEYTSRDDFLSSVRNRFSFTFEQFCEAVVGVGPAYLILEDIPSQRSVNSESITAGVEVEEIVAVALQYCPNLQVLMRTRQVPQNAKFPVAHLKPLDEPDLRVYVAEHPYGGEKYTTQDAISILYRHTDGVPARVDTALRELEVTTLDKLASVNQDFTPEAVPTAAPKAMAKAVADISTSNEPTKQRALHLLKALAEFPQGETLERVKRFNGPHPMYPVHARELIDRTLITASSEVEALAGENPAKLLVVPRPVRDFIRAQTSPKDLSEQTRRAASIYFGDKWAQGQLKPVLANRFSSPTAGLAEIANANAIVLRLVKGAIESKEKRAITSSVRLAAAYIKAISSGDHYRSVVTICRDILPLIADEDGELAVRIRASHARCLRMLGEARQARDILLSLAEVPGPNELRQLILLSLAMAHQSLKQSKEAVDVARRVVLIEKSSHFGLQARSVILEESEESESVCSELRKHEALCRKRGAHLAANNLAISRANDRSSTVYEVDDALESVLKSAVAERDFYNGARAIIRKAKLAIDRKQRVGNDDKSLLIGAYQYLFSERLSNLFDQCHNALWDVFESEAEIANLFRLFRHSSLIWRLRGDDVREKNCLARLAKHAEDFTSDDFRKLGLEASYYAMRASVALLAPRLTAS